MSGDGRPDGVQVTPTTHPSRSVREHGISLVEVLVVLMIVLILGAIGTMSLRGSRETGGRMEARAAARLYADAAQRFQLDHGRRTPVLGSTDWPTANAGPVKRFAMGGAPTIRPYLTKNIPDVMTRTSELGSRFAGSPVARGGTLVYRRSGQFRFTIDVYWNGTRTCTAGNVPVGTTPC